MRSEHNDVMFETLFECSPDACLLIENNRFIKCNQAAVAMLHADSKEQIFNTHPSAISPDIQPDGRNSYEKAEEVLATIIHTGSLHFEWMHKRMDGEELPVDVSLTLIHDGEKVLVYTVWRDISERKRATEALLEREKQLYSIIEQVSSIHTKKGVERLLPDIFDGDLGRLSSAFNEMVAEFDLQHEALILLQSEMQQQKAFAEGVLNKAAVPIFVLDVNHRIIVWNNAIENLTGFRAEEMLGTDRQWLPFYDHPRPVLADLVLSADATKLQELYGNFCLSQHVLGGLQVEGWLEHVGGQRRYLLFDAAPVFDDKDIKLGVIETLLDITQRKLSEVELAASKEALQNQHKQLNQVFSQMEKAKREWEDTMDCVSDMVLMCDTWGKIRRCNHPIIEMTGLEFEEIVGKNWMSLLIEFGI